MGSAEFINESGIDVRPHPHIGLGTVTFLFEGEFEHRARLGTHQMIYSGEVNWMTAGKGVTHSERTTDDTRARSNKLFGFPCPKTAKIWSRSSSIARRARCPSFWTPDRPRV